MGLTYPITLHKNIRLLEKCDFGSRIFFFNLPAVICLCAIPADIFLFIGAVSISLHRCSLTIQDEAPPPQ